MRRFMVPAIIGVVLAFTLALATPAHASGSGYEIGKQTTGTPYFINAWNGGPDALSYTTNVQNNSVIVVGVNRCNGGEYTTTNCPITGNPTGLLIYEIEFAGGGIYGGSCMGDDLGAGYFQDCVDPNTGKGGGLGTLQVAYHAPGCNSGYNQGINVYWSNSNGGWGHRVGIQIPDGDGNTVVINGYPADCLNYIPYSY